MKSVVMDENRAMCHQKRSLESLSLHVGELKTITARVIALRGILDCFEMKYKYCLFKEYLYCR